jgi:hypothetical protein
MMKWVVERVPIFIIVLLSLVCSAFAIPVDLTKEEKEKLDVALDKCVKGVENQFGVIFFYFLNYEARTEKDTFFSFVDIMASSNKTATPSNKPDENTRYFRCMAKLKADKWELEFKPIIIKTKEKGILKKPSLSGYKFEEKTNTDMDNDGIDETLVEKWINQKGQIILKFTTQEKIWAWTVFGNPSNREDGINNYSLVDSEGKGMLDMKYPIYEKFPFSEWLKAKARKGQ